MFDFSAMITQHAHHINVKIADAHRSAANESNTYQLQHLDGFDSDDTL